MNESMAPMNQIRFYEEEPGRVHENEKVIV